MKLFFSYSTEDIESFHLPDIINAFESEDPNNKVFYWKRDCEGGMSNIEYMTKKIAELSSSSSSSQ